MPLEMWLPREGPKDEPAEQGDFERDSPVQKYKVTPESIPGCDEEELHEHFTCLVNEGLLVGENVIRTGLGETVRDVMIPKLTLEGCQFLGDLKMP